MRSTKARNALSGMALAMLALIPLSSQASLIGDTATCSITPTPLWACSAPAFLIGPGPDLTLDLIGTPFFSVDFGASSLTLTYGGSFGSPFGLGAGETVTFGSLDWVGSPSTVITGFGITTSGVTGVDASDVSFTGHSLTIFLDGGASYSAGSVITIDLLTTAPVDEPGALAMVGLGLAGLGAARRRKG